MTQIVRDLINAEFVRSPPNSFPMSTNANFWKPLSTNNTKVGFIMGQKRIAWIITHLIIAIGVFILLLLNDETSPIDLVIFVVAYMTLNLVFDKFRDRRRAKQTIARDGFESKADSELNRKLIEALGGNDNIETASHDGNRVTIKMKDVNLIDQVKIEELSLDGAVLTDNQLKVSIGASSEDFARLTIKNVSKS